jgi:hypothetical protein
VIKKPKKERSQKAVSVKAGRQTRRRKSNLGFEMWNLYL